MHASSPAVGTPFVHFVRSVQSPLTALAQLVVQDAAERAAAPAGDAPSTKAAAAASESLIAIGGFAWLRSSNCVCADRRSGFAPRHEGNPATSAARLGPPVLVKAPETHDNVTCGEGPGR
jgi:hypothetical protein